MILLLFLILGLIIGILRGGGLSGLARMKLHALWLILISAAAELVRIFLPAFSAAPYAAILPYVQIARFFPLILFTLINIKNWRICIAAIGLIANCAVICANHWQMPIGWIANDMPSFAGKVKQMTDGLVPGYTVMKDAYSANLWFLADLLPLFRPEIGFASIGDILLGFGVLLTVQHGMAKFSIGRHARGSKAVPVASPRHTVSGRHGRHQAGAAAPAIQPAPELKPSPELNAIPEAKPAPRAEPAPRIEPTPRAEPAPRVESTRPAEPAQAAPAWEPAPTPAQYTAREAEPAVKPEPTAQARAEKFAPQAAEPPVFEEKAQPDRKAHKKPDREDRKSTKKSAFRLERGTEPQLLETIPDSMYASEYEDAAPGSYGSQIKLSPRLEVVAFMTGRAATVADVGCDHGKLSAWLAMNSSSRVIAMDISSKSLSKTKQLVKDLNLHSLVQTRVSDGLKKLKPNEADVIVISGLGGPTICSILEEGHAVASTATKLVLQPMNAVGVVRRWLADNGYCISAEQLAAEDGRIYQILSAVPGSDICPPLSLFDLEVGHLLIDNRHPLLHRLLEYKISTIDKILSEIVGIATPKAEARRSELLSLRDRCSEVLEWLAQ